jgi:hypothetical protein
MKNILEVDPEAQVISRKAWIMAKSLEAPNVMGQEHALSKQTAILYLHQRLRVLWSRKIKMNCRIKDLMKCIYSGHCYKKIREKVVEEESDIMDLTEESKKFTLETATKAQLNKVTVQCFTVLTMLQNIDHKNDSETSILEGFLSQIETPSLTADARIALLKEHEKLKKQFRTDNNMNTLSERVRLLTGAVISAKKIREWYHEYLEKDSFEEDFRGSWKRDSFLEENGYSIRFQIYLKNERKLTVDLATKELESIIQKDPPKTEDGKKDFELLKPFSRRTVHRWMIKLGCKYEKSTVSYYTDSHEAEETKKDFKERYF